MQYEVNMSDVSKYKIACHCGLASQIITRPDPSVSVSDKPPPPRDLNLCHCRPCRKNTGLLCVSYMRINTPERTEGLIPYRSTHYFERFFCGTCGCHVFWRGQGPDEDVVWAVATGVIEGYAGDSGNIYLHEEEVGRLSEPQYARHINVLGTRDGGLSTYLPHIRGKKMDGMSRWGEEGDDKARGADTGNKDVLRASCHCGNVSFHVTRPDESSHVPQRNYADLIHPYCSTLPEIVANTESEKWWLRPARPRISSPPSQAQDQLPPTRYLAGICSCRSCRLTSGFEIQSWAFVPRSNIFFHVSLSVTDALSIDTAGDAVVVALDFATLPPGSLKSYPSSLGVLREFCANCGATVFWHDQDAEVVDISAGLFDAVEGARAERWLDWWTERVSFSEEARTGRSGEVADRAEGLIESLERGMRERTQRIE